MLYAQGLSPRELIIPRQTLWHTHDSTASPAQFSERVVASLRDYDVMLSCECLNVLYEREHTHYSTAGKRHLASELRPGHECHF
jgi:hypothetical protein